MATGHKGLAPALLYALMDLRVMLCMDSHLDPLLLLMIEAPHTLHTHSRSFFIHILSVSAPATVATGHKDSATP